ncbi:MAG TPA: homoserine O-acetyltransferase, partial [Verrucomicrobiae bacterium]|nr:homoserine O-acetyltransferase [Verrucomicrobiae bacterium]
SRVEKMQYITFDSLQLENGKSLAPFTLAYHTYGTLNREGDNAVLIFHALTGDSQPAGKTLGGARGWWDPLIGPGKVFDTDKYFVVCSNVLGGCYGSTGPSSINPKKGTPYGIRFPLVTIRDMVRAQKKLVEALGIHKLAMAAGGSMGGMQALEWGLNYPEMVGKLIAVGTPGRLSPQAIAYNEVGRQAIMLDPYWRQGDYYGREVPAAGLSIARMVGTITYRSEASLEMKFGRSVANRNGRLENPYGTLTDRFDVQSYLQYQGVSLVKRFDPNSYIYLTKAMDLHDLGRGYPSYEHALARIKMPALLVGISTDILFPAYQQREIADKINAQGGQALYREIESPHGHDAFLLEFNLVEPIIRDLVHGSVA